MPSKERLLFNKEKLPMFLGTFIKKDILIIDIGKPDDGWGYKKLITEKGFIYLSLDRDKTKNPDVLLDLEGWEFLLFPKKEKAVICMGVWEQADNPYKLIEGIASILNPGEKALLGIISIGYPLCQDIDRNRITPQGLGFILSKDFITKSWDVVVNEENIPSYIFAIVEKK